MEYASFHYLMHKIPEQQKAYYVSGPSPLTYEELYSPRPRTLIVKKEVSYWRTRDRIEYALYEDRTHNVLIITCYSIDSKEAFRTIFVNLERLFYEVESKARDTKELLTSKSNKKLADDASLYKAVGEYILARLSIKANKLPWPSFDMIDNKNNEAIINSTPSLTSTDTNSMTDEVKKLEPSLEPSRPLERQCTLEKLSSDEYISIEVAMPTDSTFNLDDIPNVKLHPTTIQIEQQDQNEQSLADTAKEITITPPVVDETAKVPVSDDKAKAKPNSKIKAAAVVVKVATKAAKSKGKVAPSG